MPTSAQAAASSDPGSQWRNISARAKRRSRARESGIRLLLARVALGVTALHVVDDNFLQPQPGTSAGDHLVSGSVPIAALTLAAVAYRRVRAGARAVIAITLGIFGVLAGIEGGYYTATVGPSGDDYTGLLAIPATTGWTCPPVRRWWRTTGR